MLCNNAGVGATGDVVDVVARGLATRVRGQRVRRRQHVPGGPARDARRGRGAVVNTCSVVASVGLVDRAVYSASKGAVLALTTRDGGRRDRARHPRQLRLAGHGLEPVGRAAVAALPDPEAGFEALRRRQPLGRMVSCDEVAAAVVYLADDTTFTTGADFLLDGGITGVRIVDVSRA